MTPKLRSMMLPLVGLLVLTIAFFPGCIGSDKDDSDSSDAVNNVPSSGNKVVDANNQFAFELYKQLGGTRGTDDNMFFSPWSIMLALSMVYEGAEGDTATEMQGVLHVPKDDTARHDGFKTAYAQTNPTSGEYELSTANAFWGSDAATIKQPYLDLIDEYYGAKAQSMNFAGDPEGCTDTINDWVANNTHDKIRDIIPPGAISPYTDAVLTNAIYFKGQWVYEFDANDTTDRDFTTAAGPVKKVPTMSIEGSQTRFLYAEDDKMQALELPYKGDKVSMVLLLPKSDDISALDAAMSNKYLKDTLDSMDDFRVNMYIPSFKFENKYMLVNTMKALGMTKAFDSTQSNFSGIMDQKFAITDIIHQSFVEVNEKGTEAAAATVVIGDDDGDDTPPDPVYTFRADHPFIFIIKQNDTDNVLFLGKVSDPAK